MLDAEIAWFRDHFGGVHARLDALEADAREQRAAAQRKLDAIVRVAEHLLPFIRGLNPMDHADLLKLAQDTKTAVEGMVDDAVARFEKVEADHTSTVTTIKDSLDDVGTMFTDIQASVSAKLAAIKAPDAAAAPTDGGAPAAVPVSVTVAAPTTAPTVTIPVAADIAASTPVGSTLAGPGIPDGATVIATTDNHPQTGGPALTIDDATTADHAGGEALMVTAPAAAAQG